MRRYKPVYFLITVLLSLAIFFMIATNLDNSNNSVQTHRFEGSAKTTFLSFTVSYSIDDERMTKSYRIEDDGLISIIIEPDHPKNEPLLLASDFMKLFKQMDKNDIVEYAGSKHSIVIAEFEKLARLDQAGIPEDRMVIYKDSLVPFDEIRSDGQQAICYTTFHVNGKGVQLPIVFHLN